MDAELRPLSLGEVLDRTFQLYRSHFLLFAGIASFAAALDLVWSLLQTATVKAVQHRVGVGTLGGVSMGFGLVRLVVYIVVGAVAMAAISRAVSAIYLGQTTGIAQAYREVKPHWFRYVRLYVVAALLAWGAAILLFVGVILAGVALQRGTGGQSAALIMMGVFGLSMLVLIPFGIWMTLRYSLANASAVFEDLGVRAALKRSVFLSKGAGQKTKIFVMLFLAWVISAIITYAGLAPLLFLVFRSVMEHATPAVSTGMTIYTLLVGFATTSVTIPIYAIGLTLFYYDARIRKEGFDVEWMMERATPAEILLPATEPSPAEAANLG
ncbi:MAG TPA: hypothetical protein VGU23_00085 [Acidobacteriaceae bacterium]|nr:hypothetical protein [Acidobacteriaceae bacterium]